MARKSISFSFPNGRGQTLAGILDMPAEGTPLFTGVFAPCFTCTKESHGATKICRALAERGIAMLRFDIMGIGRSEGDVADMNFSTRVGDIIAACNAMATEIAPPILLVGHSISGTAVLTAAKDLPDIQTISSIGSPCDTHRVIETFKKGGRIVEKDGMLELDVLGQPYTFKKSFEADMYEHDVAADTAALNKDLLIFHAPNDNIVALENAQIIHDRATNAKSREIIVLEEEATHLFEKRNDDALFIAERLAAISG